MQSDNDAYRHRYILAEMKRGTWAGRQRCGKTESHPYLDPWALGREKPKIREAERQTGRETDSQRCRDAERQRDRGTER